MSFIKKYSKYVKILIICVLFSYITALATNYSYDASDVRYADANPVLESTNLQDALDEVYYHVSDYNEIKGVIGSGSLATTAQTLVGAINEVKAYTDSHFQMLGTASDPVTSLNSLPLNSIGHVVLDASISPAGVLRAYSYWKSGTNVSTRYTILAVDQYAFKMYMYDMYDDTSKGWKLITDSSNIKGGTIATNTNLNNILNPGVYTLSSSNTYTNMPDSSTAGVMTVLAPFAAGTYQKQIFYRGAIAIYVRTRNDNSGTTWSNWYKYSGSVLN